MRTKKQRDLEKYLKRRSHSPGRKYSSALMRQALWNRGHKNCFHCGYEFKSHREATLEHIVPLSKGGTNAIKNLTLACKGCNH